MSPDSGSGFCHGRRFQLLLQRHKTQYFVCQDNLETLAYGIIYIDTVLHNIPTDFHLPHTQPKKHPPRTFRITTTRHDEHIQQQQD
jgi:hypothetical protein